MLDTKADALLNEREWRCRSCTLLLGVETCDELRLRYKGFEVFARGEVTVRCRRCGTDNKASGRRS